MQSPFRVVIFSGSDAAYILRLVRRIHNEAPGARVCGVLCERRPGKPLASRTSHFLKNLRDWRFIRYVVSKLSQSLAAKIRQAGSVLLDFVHGGPPAAQADEDPVDAIRSLGCSFHVTADYHCEEALQYVRGLQADLGIVYGTRILRPSLFSIPRHGSINIHKRKVPDYRGGGPVGLWELLDGAPEIGVTVHQVTEKLDAGAIVNAAVIPIEPFDNLTSLALKAHVVGNDMLVRSVAQYAAGSVRFQPQQGTGKTFKAPSPQQLADYEKALSRRRPGFSPPASRPLAKLILKSAACLPSTVLRNWGYRRRRSFPVKILFHHLVADRPHRMGVSTEYFLKHVHFLQRHYRIVSLRRAIELMKTGSVTEPTVVLTFDDGYRDNFVNLRAVVEATGVPVTMFVSTGHITRQNEFKHDCDYGIEGFEPLTWEQVKQMELGGFEIGSHTQTHFDCGSRDRTELEKEIAGSKQDLERRLGKPVEFFSFPFGHPENISAEAAEIALRQYSCFLSAFGGNNTAPPDGDIRHLKRWCHPNRIWDLELQLQGALEAVPEEQLPAYPAMQPLPAGFDRSCRRGL